MSFEQQFESLHGEQAALFERVRLLVSDWLKAGAPDAVKAQAAERGVGLAAAEMLGGFVGQAVANAGRDDAPPFAIVIGFFEALLSYANPGELERALEYAKQSFEAQKAAYEQAAREAQTQPASVDAVQAQKMFDDALASLTQEKKT